MQTTAAVVLPRSVRITDAAEDIASLPGSRSLQTPLRRDADGSLELLMLEQPTNAKCDLIYSIYDPLGINGQTQIGLKRAQRINPMAKDECGCRTPKTIAKKDCELCDQYEEVMVSLDNPKPFGPLIHKVVLSNRHIQSADRIGVTEIKAAWEEFYRLAQQSSNLDGLTVGMNFGAYLLSGASQIHFHYQVAGLGPGNYNAGDSLGALCEAYGRLHPGADYLQDYMSAIRRAGLLIKENQHGALFVPFAQRFSNEMQLMSLDYGVGNLADTSENQRIALAQLEHHGIQILAKAKLHSFNEVWYMTRFSTDNRYGQRLVVSLCPRTSIFAMYELSHNYVIDELPWDSAASLRSHSRTIDEESN